MLDMERMLGVIIPRTGFLRWHIPRRPLLSIPNSPTLPISTDKEHTSRRRIIDPVCM